MKFKVAWFLFFAIGMIGGLLIGMTLQQSIYTAQLERFASNLDGVEINVNINETKMVEGITDFYAPYFEDMINESKDGIYDDGEPYFNKEDFNWYMNINDTIFTWNVEENIWYQVEDANVLEDES